MIFIDAIALTQKFSIGSIKEIAGIRRIAYRQPGDVNLKGEVVVEDEIIGESATSAWIKGSHETKLQIQSDGSRLMLIGNPGRFNRSDNLFNLDLPETIAKCNAIVQQQGYSVHSFGAGTPDPWTVSQLAKMNIKSGECPEEPWTGSRVWSIHLTQNYVTGSASNAKQVIDWANTQSAARVKKTRLGATTIVWGSIKYCQTELYVKSVEMLAHCKNNAEREAMKESEAYKFAEDNGIVRLEIKCAKDYLKFKKLTYLGSWNMEMITTIFNEKSEILRRCRVDVNQYNEDFIASLPTATRVHAAAWLAGIDVAPLMSRATFFRHSKILREYSIDISEKRNISIIRPILKEIEVKPLAIPSWYHLQAA
jgi:hypothetical protein